MSGDDLGLDDPSTASGRHPINIAHLVMGVALLGVVVVWALFMSDALGVEDLRWLLPAPFLLAGAAGIAAGVLSARRNTGRTR